MEAPHKSKRPAREGVESQAKFTKLRPGPGMSASDVAADQVARIQRAMIEIVADRGYSAVKVRELVLLAGVSSRAFYERFSSKEDCFLRTYEMVVRQTTGRLIAAQAGERDWRERPRLIFSSFAHQLETEPATARFAFAEAHAAGHQALEQARHAKGAFEAMIGESFARAPRGVVVPPIVIEGMMAGVGGVSRSRLLGGREGELAGLGPELMEWALCYPGKASLGLAELDLGSVWRNTMLEPLVASPALTGGEEPAIGDRAVILTAVASLAASNGYAHLTVPRIRSRAGVSRAVFGTYFEGVEDCFVAALEQRTGEAIAQTDRARMAGQDASGGTYRAVAALCDQVASDPILAGACQVNHFALSSIGQRSRERLIATLAAQFVENGPADQRASALSMEATAAATWAVFAQHIIRGPDSKVAASLSFLALAPTVGASGVVAAINREQGV